MRAGHPSRQDGGYAAQQLMEESKQSVEEVKRVVAEARRKPGTLTPAPQADFNEDDFMDGMQPSPSGSPSRAAKYDRSPTTPAHHHRHARLDALHCLRSCALSSATWV